MALATSWSMNLVVARCIFLKYRRVLRDIRAPTMLKTAARRLLKESVPNPFFMHDGWNFIHLA